MNPPRVLVSCRYCGKPLARVTAGSAIEVRCSDRGCRMWNNYEILVDGTLKAGVQS